MTELPLWTPDAARVARTNLDAFRHTVNARFDLDLADSVALHAWSVAESGLFWDTVWDATGVIGDKGATAHVPGGILDARFFPGARLNMAETMLQGPVDLSLPAIHARQENGDRRTLTWEQLRHAVAATAAALRAEGVGPGDRVAAWLPNVPEAVIAMLATISIGAVFSSTSPDFGVSGVVDRFGQIEPTVLFAADGYQYGGQRFDCLERLRELRPQLPSVRRVVVVGHLADTPAVGAIPDAVELHQWLDPHGGAPLRFERVGFEHPGFVLYSSGTTGKPKCIVHRAAGVLLKHLEEQQQQCDVKAGDVVFYFTTCGWMMWNWLTSALASRATIVLYEGNPAHPGPTRLFDLAERDEVNLFGVSAKFIDASRKAGVRPRDTHRLPALRTICSTGSPLVVEAFEWVYDAVKPDVHLASISGGTDLCGCFVGGDPTRPVYAGEIQGSMLGMAADVFDERGHPVGPGVKGELACTQAFPTVPLGFWRDDDGSRFRAAYFDRFPGAWAHGDFAAWTGHGGMHIFGRSDATLNASGVRIGTAEIYRVVEQFPEIVEAIAVGQAWDDDTRIVLFVRLATGAALTDDLQQRLKGALRQQASPRHVPARIVAVDDIPRTRSGKIVELAVTDVVHGRPVRNVEALANPEALTLFADRPELAR